jgi:phage replication O-like protein O
LTGKHNPQLENGHTRVANELLEAITVYPFTMAQLKVILAVIRNTYGWSRKTARLSYGRLSSMTVINKRHLKRVVEELVSDGILLKQKEGRLNVLGINKRYTGWKLWKTLSTGDAHVTTEVTHAPPDGGAEDTTKGASGDTTQKKERYIYKERSKGPKYPQNRFLKAVRARDTGPVHISSILGV